ncbi:MAG: hypothetical protein K6T85_06335, partial [Gorillibacterium sp.]|nr:hypothetical protein [Gorillibacterium sp.]
MKIIFYFVTVNIIVLALSFILLYRISSQTLLKEIGSHSESLLVNTAKNTAQLMEWSIDYSYSSSDDPLLQVYALSDEYNDLDTYTVWTRLMDIKKSNPSIDSVYLINDYTKKIIDSRLGVTDFASFNDQEILTKLRNREIGDKLVLLPRVITLPLGSSEQKKVITLVINYETNGKSLSAFVLNVDTEKMMTLLQKNTKFEQTNVSIFNEADELVFTTSTLSGTELLELSRQSKSTASGWKLFHPLQQEEQLLVYSTTSIKGIQQWKFIETIPKAVILENINILGKISFILFISLFITSLGVIILISKRVYSPIQELVHNVMLQHHAEKFGERKGASEMDYLSDVFVSQSERIHELTEHWRSNTILEREQYMRELLRTSPASLDEIRTD